MRSIVFGLFVAILAPAQDTMVVERGRVGPIAIGATAESVYDKFGDRATLVDLKLEGMLTPAIAVKLFGSQPVPSIIAEIGPRENRLVVYRISVIDPRLKTKEGIGVGSTYAELRSRYSIDSVGSGEGNFVAVVETLGMGFHLDTSGPTPLWTIRDPNQVPRDVRVTRITLTQALGVVQQSPPVLRTAVDVITIDVQVVVANETQGKDAPTRELAAADFEITIAGHKRVATSAVFVHYDEGTVVRSSTARGAGDPSPECVFGFHRTENRRTAHYVVGVDRTDADQKQVKDVQVKVVDRTLLVRTFLWRTPIRRSSLPKKQA